MNMDTSTIKNTNLCEGSLFISKKKNFVRLQKGAVIWITGLSDSGKSTLARLLSQRLRRNFNSITLLDGDQLREVFGVNKNYDRDSRLNLGFKYSKLCKMLAEQGHIVIIATIALLKEIHTWNRAKLPGYFEVFLNIPIEELRRRDSKGLYRRYDLGETTHVYGLDLKADYPKCPDFKINFDPKRSAEFTAEELAQLLTNYHITN